MSATRTQAEAATTEAAQPSFAQTSVASPGLERNRALDAPRDVQGAAHGGGANAIGAMSAIRGGISGPNRARLALGLQASVGNSRLGRIAAEEERGNEQAQPSESAGSEASATRDSFDRLSESGVFQRSGDAVANVASLAPGDAAVSVVQQSVEASSSAPGASESGSTAGAAVGDVEELDVELAEAEEAATEVDSESASAEGESRGEGESAAGGAEGSPAGGTAPGGGGDVEILMPEPPMELNEEERGRIGGVNARAGSAGAAVRQMPSAGEQTADARGAVEEPAEETAARAEAALIEALGEAAPPDPELVELCNRIRDDIRNNRPPSEEDVYEADPRRTAEEVGNEVSGDVAERAEEAGAAHRQIEEVPEGEARLDPTEPEAVPETVGTEDLAAESAVPDEIPAEDVSLDADVEATDERIEEAGLNTPAAREAARAGSGPIADVDEGRGELGEMAARDPAEVLAEQQAAIGDARAGMAELQLAAVEALQASRAGTVTEGRAQQEQMVGSERDQRTAISQQAEAIFSRAQTAVTGLLEGLPQQMEQRWTSGIAPLSTQFEADLENVKQMLEDRYEGVSGWFAELGDALVGIPDNIANEYTRAEANFVDGVCDLALEISSEVNTILQAADTIIANANAEIDALFENLGPSLAEWAEQERASFQTRLDGLSEDVANTREDLRQGLLEQSSQTIHEARSRVHELRQAARGLLGRIADAIVAFAEDPGRFILEGLLELVGISPPAFWALLDKIGDVVDEIADDPMRFANAAVAALKQGFEMFFDNIGDHLLQGFIDWLFSAMGTVGVSLPPDTSLKSLITFFLQLMGLTWPNIREILVRHVGEENVALIEKAWELISSLIEMGPEGLFEMIKEKLDPSVIFDLVLNAAIDYIIETVVTQATARIIGLFNPAGAIVQAVELIFRVLKWVFDNAARIFTLVETVVNGVADLLAGQTSGLAAAIERSLAGLIPTVIDFIAGYIGLGNLPEKIAEVVGGLQERVLAVVDRVIGFLVERAKGLLSALGFGGEEEEEAEDLDPTDHDAVATQAVQELEGVDASGDYDDVRQAVEAKAAQVESTYSAMLEEGIGLTVRLADVSSDQEDRDVDFTVVIAPNNTEKEGTTPTSVPARIEPPIELRFNLPRRLREGTVTDAQARAGYTEAEFDRQLKGQEAGINAMDVASWKANRDRYATEGRDPDSRTHQRQERENAAEVLTEWLQLPVDSPRPARYSNALALLVDADNYPDGMPAAIAEARVGTWMRQQAALHDPDQVAGGEADAITGLGHRSINSSLGSQWGNGKANELQSGVDGFLSQHSIPPEETETTENIAMAVVLSRT